MMTKHVLWALAVAGWFGAPAHAQKLVKGTKAADTLYAHGISGEPRIAQDYLAAGTGATGPNGETLRADDPNDPVRAATRTYFPGQPYFDHKVTLIGYAGPDQFIIKTYESGKPAIVAKHVNADGTIDWAGVAGENANVHDHWTEYFGEVQINDFSRAQGDTLTVRGHTVALKSIRQVGADSLVTVQSQQGNGGGAHDEDVLGTILVKNVALTADDIAFVPTNDGIAKTFPTFLTLVQYYDQVAQSLRGKQTIVNRRGNKLPMFAYDFADYAAGHACDCGKAVCESR